MAREHITYIDRLRFVAAVGVVFMHTASEGLGIAISPSWHGLNMLASFAFCSVPLFFMISGYLLLTDEKTLQPRVLFLHRLPRLIVPLAGWSVVAVIWSCISAGDFSFSYWAPILLYCLYRPVLLPYWFMYTLIVIYLLSPLLYGGVQSLGHDGRRYMLAIIMIISLRGLILAILPAQADRFTEVDALLKLQSLGGYLLLFLLGYLLGTTKHEFSRVYLIITAVGSWLLIALGTWYLTSRNGTYDASYQNQSAGLEVLLASCLFLLAKQSKKTQRKWERDFAPLLFPIYLMHAVLLNMFYAVGIRPVRFVGVVGATILNMFICGITLVTVMTIKPICFLATGIHYESACTSCNWVYIARQLRARSRKKTGDDN